MRFNGLISRLDMGRKKSVSLKYVNKKIPELKCKEKKRVEKKNPRAEHPRTVGQFQKVWHTHYNVDEPLNIAMPSESQTKEEYMLCNSIYRTF